MNEVQKRFKRNLPQLDPETDMSVTDSDYRKSQRKSETLEGLLKKHPLASSATLEERLSLLRHKQVTLPLAKPHTHPTKVSMLLLPVQFQPFASAIGGEALSCQNIV